MERKLGLPVAPDLPFNERPERIRTAMVTIIERGADPVSAMRLQNDSEVAVIQFIRTVVEHDNRKGKLNHRRGQNLTTTFVAVA